MQRLNAHKIGTTGRNAGLAIASGICLFGLFFCSRIKAQTSAPSDDPLSVWHQRSLKPSDVRVEHVVFAGGRFVAYGPRLRNFNQIWTSFDGTNWTGHSTGTTNHEFTSVAYGNGVFLAVDCSLATTNFHKPLVETTLLISPNGMDWSRLPLNGNPVYQFGDIDVGALAFGNGKFMMFGHEPDQNNRMLAHLIIWTSTDGRNWTAFRPYIFWSIQDLRYAKDRFISLEGAGAILSIFDIDAWRRTRNSGALLSDVNMYATTTDMAYGNGRFVVVGSAGGEGGFIATSPDAKKWTRVQPPPPMNHERPRGIAFGGNHFVAPGSSGTVMVSTDGTDWSQRRINTNTISYSSIAYGNGTFVVVGIGSVYQSDPIWK